VGRLVDIGWNDRKIHPDKLEELAAARRTAGQDEVAVGHPDWS
jgi:hypothetical protein